MDSLDLGIRDIRTGEKVKIHKVRFDQCKSNVAIPVVTSTDNDGNCHFHQQVFVPGGQVNNEYLVSYDDGSISWVDGKLIK